MISQEPHGGPAFSGRIRVGEWSVDPALDEISRGAEVIKLEPRMMRLLCRLAETRGQVTSSQQLLESVWPGVVVGPASVYQAISALRKILGDSDTSPTYIATVPRKGYRLIAAVQPETGRAPAAARLPGRRPSRLTLVAGTLASLVAILAVLLTVVLGRAEPTPSIAAPLAVAWPAPDLPSIAILPFQSTAPDDSSGLFAASITDLLNDRLATQKALLVVSVFSAGKLVDPGVSMSDIGTRLHARYALRGDASRAADGLRVHVTLLDTASGAGVWSQSYACAASETTALREDIVAHVGAALKVKLVAVGNVPVDLAAHELYIRGLKEYQRFNKEGFVAAREIFQRATALYPDFPRAYFGLAMALNQMPYYTDSRDPASDKRNIDLLLKALDRAIELDPDFGPALIDRAEHTDDPVEAEKMFRRGLELVPSFDIGAFKYGMFLNDHGRIGEGLAALNRGLRIDPLSPMLLETKAFTLAQNRGDVAGHDAVLRELLANHPQDTSAMIALGRSRYGWSGETAAGIGDLERAIARDPDSPYGRGSAAAAYLEVDDPDAASAVANGIPFVLVEIAQYRRDAHPIALLPPAARGWWRMWNGISVCPVGEALRDEAIATKNYAAALAEFEHLLVDSPDLSLATRVMELMHAHTLVLSGDTERGRKLATSVLRMLEAEQVERPAHWFARDRATAHAILGDEERALAELADSMKHKHFVRWWYTAELDPLFAHLRKDPRFQALAATARQHRATQRALLDEMRRKGEVPTRP